eukprot:COSAG01_NODE_18522_length_1068_cov_1.818744_1_plen_308_part_01
MEAQGPLTAGDLAQFRREGYVVARGLLPRSTIEAVQAEISEAVDEFAEELLSAGEIQDTHSGLGFLHRVPALWQQCPRITGMVAGEVGFPKPTARRPNAGSRFFALLTAPTLLSAMEQIMNSTEVCVSGVYRLRPKLPDHPGGVVPWHQDQCFFAPCSDALPTPLDWSERPPVISAWVPLMDATMEAGGMEVLAPAMPELVHHYGANVLAPGTTIHPDHFPAGMRVEPAPAMIGDVLLFSAYTPHRSTENRAGVMRWAADIRYHVPQAGDYYPHEWGFLGKSARRGAALTDWREYVTKRSAHRAERAR